ncbi:MAG: hypothetical protein D6819_03990, partial [Gammaproteobacteria bacterium]
MLPEKTRLIQHPALPDPRQWDAMAHGILLKPSGSWPAFPYSDSLERRWRALPPSMGRSPWITEMPNAQGTRLAIADLRASTSPFEQLTQARKLAALIGEREPERVDLLLVGLPEGLARRGAEAVTSALLARAPLPSFKG